MTYLWKKSEMDVAESLSQFDAIGINIFVNDEKLIVTSPIQLTNSQRSFLRTHRASILEVLGSSVLWDSEPASEGYVWCLDCQYWGRTACTHTDNPFRNQQPLTPRKCRWYEA